MLRKMCFLIVLTIIVTACASIELQPQATRVIASPNEPGKNCKYVGQIVGNQGNFFTGAWTSNKNLELGAINDLKNQASKLGANYVQIINSRAGETGSYGSYNGNLGGSSNETNVVYVGNAYYCKNLY